MNFKDYFYLQRYALAKKGAVQAYKKGIKHQHLDESELKELSWQKTKKLLTHAYENVAWYHETFKKQGLHPNDIRRPEHYAQVPILKRQDIINNFEKFIAKGTRSKDLNYITTGGSSGEPLKIGVNKDRIREVQKWQMFNWWDTPLNANMASVYRGLPVGGLKALALGIINWPQKVIRLDATQITPNKIEIFISNYQKIQPKIIHGYVGAMDAIADYILEQNISFNFKPNAIWLTAAPVTKLQEQKISKAFNNAAICDQYGCSEIYFIASECSHKKGLHIFADSVKLEIVNKRDEIVNFNEHGKIILTNLDEFSFPLIRYENGDEGRLLKEKCTCGMSLPLLDKVKGRISDNIVLPDGTILSGEYLTTIFDDYTDSVKQFQIIQKKDLSITVKICLYDTTKSDYINNEVYKQLELRINNQVPFKIEFVSDIKSEKGKLRFIIKEN